MFHEVKQKSVVKNYCRCPSKYQKIRDYSGFETIEQMYAFYKPDEVEPEQQEHQ